MIFVDALMNPLVMIVLEILRQDMSQLLFGRENQLIETFLFDGPNESLGIGVEVGTSCKFRDERRWEHDGYIHFGDVPGEKPNITVVNLTSRIKPFQIFDMDCNFTCFAHEHHKDVSHFPWWNHWPVAQVPSDGRYCQAPDRASHFSLAWASSRPRQQEVGSFVFVWAWMYGTTDQEPKHLAGLAKSGVYPPEIIVKGPGLSDQGYDRTQRNYALTRTAANVPLELTLQADEESPSL